ncbi:MAG: arginine repressor [Clostridia bacterium]|nr:arginine repressor [Clostridia bacterium]
MKNLRQKAIIEIIENYEVDTQQRLAELLKQAGFDATQATVSRDIKVLSLIKVATNHGTYKYALPGILRSKDDRQKFQSILTDGITSVEVAGNIVVIKTDAGMANAVCTAMDQLSFDGVVGTIAGDDTIFMAVRSESQALTVKQRLLNLK